MFGDKVSDKRWKDGMGDVENKDQEIDGRNKPKGDGKKKRCETVLMEKMTLCEALR